VPLFWSRKSAPPPVMVAPKAFDPIEVFRENFPLAGSVALDRCPVCDSAEIGRLWQLPQTRLGAPTYLHSPGSPFHDFYLDYLPLLKVPQRIFVFDICRRCHSIFRNPKDDDHASYVRDTSKIAVFKTQGTAPFDGITKLCEKGFPRNTRRVVDAACGSGQVLAILRQRHPELELMGLELSRPAVEFIRSLGIEAAAVDLDFDDLDAVVAPESVDFIVFYEAFEHVRKPLTVLKKLTRMLRRGGRLHFSAQYYGPESELQVRVGEPIYIDRHGLDWVVSQLDADLFDLTVNIKFRVTLEKR
jgi:SAM-dependent methyltransferase